MSATNQTSVPLVGAGGIAPYRNFVVVAGAGTTIPATISTTGSGTLLTVDASSAEPGNYTVEVQVTDQSGAIATLLIPVAVLDPSRFAILTRDLSYEPATFPYAATVALSAVGGNGSLTWTLVPSVTTLPNASVSGATLALPLNSFGQWAVGVRVTDALGNTCTRVLNVSVQSASLVSVVDGQAIIKATPTESNVGVHQFTLTTLDSKSDVVRNTFTYTIGDTISELDIPETVVDYVWGVGDTTTIVYPLSGDLSGLAVGQGATFTASNGLQVVVDPATETLQVSGPPTSFGNSEVEISIPIMQSSTQVATLMRDFTLVSHNITSASMVGIMTCRTRPYLVGEMVGLNPLRPYFNSPDFAKNSTYTVQLAVGGALPSGLSLDSVSGLIYGHVLAANVASSILQYVDGSGTVQGTVTVVWDILSSQFQLTDNLAKGLIQSPYTGLISTTSSAPLSSAILHRGTLPAGLTLSISTDRMQVQLTGAPTAAGFFDVWVAVMNTNGQTAYLQKRLVVDYVTPLVLLTSNLQRLITGAAFSQTLQAVGGVAPYTWSLPAGTLPTGITLNANSGVISGTTAATNYNQTITLQVTDSRGVTATAALPFTLNNSLTIVTPVLPQVIPGQIYQYALQAEGGQGSYAWSLALDSAALPGGLSLSASGILSGATSLESYSETLDIKVTDGASNTANNSFQLSIGTTNGLIIDAEGVGPIIRGQSYLGTLIVLGASVAPYTWAVTPDSPNLLPAGLMLNTTTGLITGQTTASILNVSVKFSVVDSNGNQAFTFVMLSSESFIQITTNSLPQGTVNGAYPNTQLACNGANGPFTWSIDPSSPLLVSGLTLTSGGLLAGTPTTTCDLMIVFRVTDASGDYETKTLELVAMTSTLAIITPPPLPGVTAGLQYSTTLAASGGTAPYTWSISPASQSAPGWLSINPQTGAVSGMTYQGSISYNVTFRVTDSVNVIREATYTIVVATALTLTTGPDSIQNTNTQSLGMVANGDVSGITGNNLSFYVVASPCISTSPSGLSFGLPTGFSATVQSLMGGTAIIKLSGPFSSGAVGVNSFNMSILDSGVSVSAAFTWTKYSESPISIVPATGSLPQLITD